MFSASFYIIVLLVFLGSLQVEGFIVKDGNCSVVAANVPFVQDFEVEKFQGVWYERERYEQAYERNLECVTTQYRSSEPIGMLEMKTRGLQPLNETFQTFTGIGSFSEPPAQNGTAAKLIVNFGKGLNGTNYWIVDTDYDNFAMVYSCTSFATVDQSAEGYWLLSRTRKRITDVAVLERVTYLRSTYFDPSHMRPTNQTDELCPTEPALPPPPSSEILPPL